MGTPFSKLRSKKARSSAAQIVTLCDQHGVPVSTQRISDGFVQKDTMIQNKPNITAPAAPTKLLVATSELLHARQQIIRSTFDTAGLTLDQGGVRLSTWRDQSDAVTEYSKHWESGYVGPKIRTKAH